MRPITTRIERISNFNTDWKSAKHVQLLDRRMLVSNLGAWDAYPFGDVTKLILSARRKVSIDASILKYNGQYWRFSKCESKSVLPSFKNWSKSERYTNLFIWLFSAYLISKNSWFPKVQNHHVKICTLYARLLYFVCALVVRKCSHAFCNHTYLWEEITRRLLLVCFGYFLTRFKCIIHFSLWYDRFNIHMIWNEL